MNGAVLVLALVAILHVLIASAVHLFISEMPPQEMLHLKLGHGSAGIVFAILAVAVRR